MSDIFKKNEFVNFCMSKWKFMHLGACASVLHGPEI